MILTAAALVRTAPNDVHATCARRDARER